MVYKVVIADKAFNDLTNIFDWYDDHSPDASNRFLDEINNCIKKITASPSIYKTVTPGIQRCLMKIFPYIICFADLPKGIVVLRIRHKKQKMLKRFR